MQKHKLAKRIVSAFLTLAMFAGVTLTASADTIVIDGSGFKDPTITKGTVYYWHKGMPPAKLDGTSYPVIITWDDKYYLGTDSAFYSEIVGKNKTKHAEDFIQPKIDDEDDTQDVDFDDEQGYKPSGYYHRGREYTGKSVSELPFDYNVLKSTGTAVSLGAPGLPRFIAVDVEHSRYGNLLLNNGLDVNLDSDTEQNYAVWFPNPNTGSVADAQKYWLTSTHRIYSRYEELDRTFGTKAHYINSLDWYLDFKRDTQANFTNKEVTYTPEHNGLNSRGHEARPKANNLRARTWMVSKLSDAETFAIFTQGGTDAHLTSFYPDSGRDKLKHYVSVMDGVNTPTVMMHVRNNLLTTADGGGPESKSWRTYSWYDALNPIGAMSMIIDQIYRGGGPYDADGRYEDQKDFMDAKVGFDLYWGEPATISFCQLDFTVQKGQVQTFDGPIAVGHGATITVEDGGVLSCSDWIINNGTIVVKPGGTLLLQTYETANEQIRYGTISSLPDAAGSDGGRIFCDGTIIVMPDCKLCCSGKYGLQLGEGAQVVNYGAIISENLSAAQSYTIENRGDNSWVFPGWGLSDGGSSLLSQRITSSSYIGKAAKEKAAEVNLPQNAVYGKGAARIDRNSASTVSYKTEIRKGGVTDNIVPVEPLPDDPAGGGKKVQNFKIDDTEYYYTVYYPDSRKSISTMKTETSFVIYEDTAQESYLFYEYQPGVDGRWVTKKEILDVTKPVEVYKGLYNPDLANNSAKLLFKGYLYDWDGSDSDYFSPPVVDELPILDVRISETYRIQFSDFKSYTETPDKYVYCYAKSRILLYEKNESMALIWNAYIKDYIAKKVLPVDDTVKIYHISSDPQTYIVRETLVYEGVLGDFEPTYILDE